METSTRPTAPASPVKSLTGRRDAVQSTKAAATPLPHVETPSPGVEMSSDDYGIRVIARSTALPEDMAELAHRFDE